MELAQRSIALDFLFIFSYALCFFSVALLLARRIHGKFQSMGLRVSVLPFVAGFLDIIENLSLLNLIVIFWESNTPPAGILIPPGTSSTINFYYEDVYHFIILAGICALIKFTLLGLVAIYILSCLGYSLFMKFRTK